MYLQIPFVDDVKGSIFINEAQALLILDTGSKMELKYQKSNNPAIDSPEEVLVDSRGTSDLATVAATSKTIIEMTGAGEHAGYDVGVNAQKIRSISVDADGNTAVLLEQNSRRPRLVVVSDTPTEINALIAAKYDDAVTQDV